MRALVDFSIRHARQGVATFRDPWGHADWALGLRTRFPAPVIGSKHGTCFDSGAWDPSSYSAGSRRAAPAMPGRVADPGA